MLMNEEQIKRIVRAEIQNHASGARFGLNSIPRHTHNGVDSPPAFQPVITYVGLMNQNGTGAFLPSGWVAYITGAPLAYTYVVIHNLSGGGSSSAVATVYSVVACVQSSGLFVTPVVTEYANYFTVEFINSLGQQPDTPYSFFLTATNNKPLTLVTYSGSLIK